MALKSTIFKASLAVADIDHAYYADHSLTLARHPSETDERMMVRLAALALHAHEVQTRCKGDAVLAFGAGLSDPDDPDVRLTDFTGALRLWIEVGQPDEKALSTACSRSDSESFSHASKDCGKSSLARLANPSASIASAVALSASPACPVAAAFTRRMPARLLAGIHARGFVSKVRRQSVSSSR